MSKSAVAVVGSANLDMVFGTPRLPVAGETILGGTFAMHPGGKGANQACAIGRLGGDVKFVGCVGRDANGDALVGCLNQCGVDTAHVVILDSVPSGVAAVVVSEEGANQIVVAPGANSCVTPSQVTTALAAIAPAVVLCQLEVPLDAVAACASHGQFVLNPAPACVIPASTLANVKVLTPNETEAEILTGIKVTDTESASKASLILLDRGVEHVIVTLGANGCYWQSAAGGQHFAARSVRAVDTTAAGDAFSGSLSFFLASGRDIANSIELAGCVAALSTTKHGAMESMPTMAELTQFAGTLV